MAKEAAVLATFHAKELAARCGGGSAGVRVLRRVLAAERRPEPLRRDDVCPRKPGNSKCTGSLLPQMPPQLFQMDPILCSAPNGLVTMSIAYPA